MGTASSKKADLSLFQRDSGGLQKYCWWVWEWILTRSERSKDLQKDTQPVSRWQRQPPGSKPASSTMSLYGIVALAHEECMEPSSASSFPLHTQHHHSLELLAEVVFASLSRAWAPGSIPVSVLHGDRTYRHTGETWAYWRGWPPHRSHTPLIPEP